MPKPAATIAHEHPQAPVTQLEQHGLDRAVARGVGTVEREDELIRRLAPGGAGIGVPRDRDRTQVANDLADGLITSETAEKIYEFKPPQAAE